MAYETVGDAIIEAAQLMSLVNGENMTPYSDNLIMSLLAQAFNFVSKEQVWSEAILTYTKTLDGTTGQITVGIATTEVNDAKKIYRVYHESSQKPLPRISGYINPLISTYGFGYALLSPGSDPAVLGLRKLIQFNPLTLTGSVMFKAKKTYDFTDRTTVIPIDFWSHVYFAAWLYSNMDGTNPAQMEAFKDAYNNALKLAKDEENARSLSLDPYVSVPDLWVESDDPYWSSGA